MFERIDADRMGIAAVADAARLDAAIASVAAVTVAPEITAYVVSLIRATRETPDLASGASPRAGALLARAAAAQAALQGRGYVIPDDVQSLAPDLLRHRLLLSPSAEIDGRQIDAIVADLVASVEAPK